VSKLTPLHVDYVTYMDDIAGEVGVRPSLLWLFFTDYSLFQWVLWGPLTAYQYRLKGSGKWEGARGAIFTQFDRMFQPLKTRKVGSFSSKFLSDLFLKLDNRPFFPLRLFPAGGRKGVHPRPPYEAEPRRRGWRSCRLLHPRSQPGHHPGPAVQPSSTSSLNTLR